MAKSSKQKGQARGNAISDYQDLADLMVNQFEKIYLLLEKKPDRGEVKKMIKTEVGEIARTEFKEIVKTEVDKIVKAETGKIMNNITRLNDKTDDYRAEQIGMQRQLDKHEKWHFVVAKKAGVTLPAE